MSNDTRNCNQCGKEEQNRTRLRNYYRQKIRKNGLRCLVCDRDIQQISKRKYLNKYCSDKCMVLHNKIKHGQKTVRIKIPVKIGLMKHVIIPVKDIPLLFPQ